MIRITEHTRNSSHGTRSSQLLNIGLPQVKRKQKIPGKTLSLPFSKKPSNLKLNRSARKTYTLPSKKNKTRRLKKNNAKIV